jgi:hypothetical protein
MMSIVGGALTGIIGILSIGLKYGLSDGWTAVLQNTLSTVLILVISGALLIFLLTGGLAVLRHSIVRRLLWRSRAFPLLAPQFLDDATARFLLRRVGGGYSFVHRLLLDHLADTTEHEATRGDKRGKYVATAWDG